MVSDDTHPEAYQMIAYFIPHRQTDRWSVETTFGLVRAHFTRPHHTKDFDMKTTDSLP